VINKKDTNTQHLKMLLIPRRILFRLNLELQKLNDKHLNASSSVTTNQNWIWELRKPGSNVWIKKHSLDLETTASAFIVQNNRCIFLLYIHCECIFLHWFLGTAGANILTLLCYFCYNSRNANVTSTSKVSQERYFHIFWGIDDEFV